jgi:hypothetical protein
MTVESVSHPSAEEAPRPTPVERARTVAGSFSAMLCAAGVGSSPVPAHASSADGEVLLVVPSDGALATVVSCSITGDLPALLTFIDQAPVPLREPVQARLWLSGWLTPVRRADRSAAVLAFADGSPSGVLLDVRRTASILRLDLADVVLAETGPAVEIPLSSTPRLPRSPGRRRGGNRAAPRGSPIPKCSCRCVLMSRPRTPAPTTWSAPSGWTAGGSGCGSRAAEDVVTYGFPLPGRWPAPAISDRSYNGFSAPHGGPPPVRRPDRGRGRNPRETVVRGRASGRAALAVLIAGAGCPVALQAMAAPTAVAVSVGMGMAMSWVLLPLDQSAKDGHGAA